MVSEGVDLDTNVMSFQGGGHVILGSFEDYCPGIPSLCDDSFSVSFWMKHGGKRFSSHNHDLNKCIDFMFYGVFYYYLLFLC